MEKICVKAAPLADKGLAGQHKVCKEGVVARYITEHESVEVNATPYYINLIADGVLMKCEAPGAVKTTAPKPKKPRKIKHPFAQAERE